MFVKMIKGKKKEVVVIFPYTDNKVLMQLRDFKPYIDFPGHWGLFGGSIEGDEEPLKAAKRELIEEIGYMPRDLHAFGKEEYRPELGNIIVHPFFCSLTKSVESLVLNEGVDAGLFTLKDIVTKKLYSKKLKKYFPIISTPYFEAKMTKLKCLQK